MLLGVLLVNAAQEVEPLSPVVPEFGTQESEIDVLLVGVGDVDSLVVKTLAQEHKILLVGH